MCAAPKTMEQIADRHSGPLPPLTKGCESRRRLVRFVPPIYGLWHCFTHTSCVCNDVIACTNRVLGVVPLATRAGVEAIEKSVRQLWPYRHINPLSLEEALATFKGTKNKLYTRAYESLRVEPISERDARIKAFVKAERFDPADKINPDPRMIQARDPRYNLHLARYLRGIEHSVYGLKRGGLPVIVKCKNPRQRAELLFARWKQFDRPVCFSLDASRWDKHVNIDVLRVEHNFYRQWYPAEIELDRLLRWQERNRCVTSNGVRYVVNGGRMSGDMNTALGNCLLMVAMIHAAMRGLGIKDYQIIDDGDDCLVLTEEHNYELLNAELPRIFLTYGQELKIENVARHPQDVVFCQSKLTLGADGWTFARNWRKVLSHSCCGTKHWNDPNMVRPMFGMLGDCENAIHRGVPIIQVYATRLRELSKGARANIEHLDSGYQYRIGSYQLGDIKNIDGGEITTEARVEFERTWGVDPSTQLHIERTIMQWDPREFAVDVPIELVATDWTQRLHPGIRNPTFN